MSTPTRWQIFSNLLLDESWSFEYQSTSESGLGDGWTKAGSPTLTLDTTVYKHESHSQKCVGISANDGIYQDVDVSESTAYSFICWEKVTAGTLGIKIAAYTSGDVLISTPIDVTKTDATLTKYQVTFTAPATTSYVRISFFQSGASAATFYIDAVCLGTGSDLEVEVNPTSFTMRRGALVDFQRLTDGTLVKVKPSDVSTEIGEISSPVWVFVSQTQKDAFDALVNERIIIITHLVEVLEFDLIGAEYQYLPRRETQVYAINLTLKSVTYPD